MIVINVGASSITHRGVIRVLDNIVEIPQFNIGNYRTIDSSPLNPYNRDTYISYATSTTNEGISKQLER